MRADLARWRESEWQLGRALYDMISRWKRMGRFAIWMGSYTHLIFLCPSPASHQGGRRNGEQTLLRDHAVLVSSVGFCLLVCYFRCVGYACAYGVRRPPFFNSKKRKQKMPLSCAEGALHSAKRFAGRTPCAGLRGGLQNRCGLRDGLARCARWVYRRVFWDGLFAMAFLNA